MYHKQITITTSTKYLHHLVLGIINDSIGEIVEDSMSFNLEPYMIKKELKTFRDYLYLVDNLCKENKLFKEAWVPWLMDLRGLVSQLDDHQIEYVNNMVEYSFLDYNERRY